MPAGDVRISKLKIGDIDLTQYKQASYVGLNIYEDILNVYGPVGEIRVLDHSDALGKNNLNGAYNKDVEVTISGDSGEARTFKFKMFQNKNLNDNSMNNVGSGHSKQYDIRCVSKELLNAQGNPVQKSYKDQTHKIVEDILKKNFKTDKQVDIKSKTDGKKTVRLNSVHPIKALKNLNSIHESNEDKSSCFVLYQETGQQSKYVFATYEKLFKEQSVVTLKQKVGLDAGGSSQDKADSIMWFKASDNFFTPTRSMSKAKQKTFNFTTGANRAPEENPETSFKLPDSPVYKGEAKEAKEVPVFHTNDKANQPEKHKIADAKTNRAAFLSHLAQNSAELETYFNPKIKLGSMITLQIPNKSEQGGSGGEKQFNGKCLVVAIRTKIKPFGQAPRATMILRVVKASYKEGGNGEA